MQPKQTPYHETRDGSDFMRSLQAALAGDLDRARDSRSGERHSRGYGATVGLPYRSQGNPAQLVALGAPLDDFFRRDLTVTVGTGGGNTVGLTVQGPIPWLQDDLTIERLRIPIQTGLRENIDVVLHSNTANAAAVAENAANTETAATVTRLQYSPKTITAYVDASRRLIDMTAPLGGVAWVQRHLFSALKREILRELTKGTGAPEMAGLVGLTGVNVVNGATLTAALTADSLQLCSNNGGDLANYQWLASPDAADVLRQRASNGTGSQPLGYGGTAMGFPLNVSSTLGTAGALLVGGDWSQSSLMVWGDGIDILVDPFTGSNAGTVRVSAFAFCDWAVVRPNVFTTTTGVS
jgi:HK97 family phage major capsid protein